MSHLHTLENKTVKATFTLKGAELSSFIHKTTGKEYIWQADKTIWARHAPILFPIVGKLKEDSFTYEGDKYSLPQHGFARDLDFELTASNKNELVFSLSDSSNTKSSFPFKFHLNIRYKLIEETLTIYYEVHNNDQKDIYFSIGAHPAFNCPINDGEQFESYYLEFNEPERPERYLLNNGLFTGQKEPINFQGNKLALTYDLFKKDAVVFKQLKSQEINLRSSIGDNGVKVSYQGFPYLGIWTKAYGTPFICIEPWYGLADSEKSTGNISEKEGIQSLGIGEWFKSNYSIQIF